MMQLQASFDARAFAEHERLVAELGALCGLGPGQSAEHCGRAWCGYFDGAQSRCGLLALDVPARLGPEALRWFVAHRTNTTAAVDDAALATRCASF